MDNQSTEFGTVSLTGRLRSAIEVNYAADNRRYTIFEITPANDLNGDTSIRCIAWNTRAEVLYRFASRGDMLTVTGKITAANFITDTGNYFRESNIIEATGIDLSPSAEPGTEVKETA